GRRRCDAHVGPVTEPVRGLEECHYRLVIGDGRVAVMDEETGRRLEAYRPGGDDEVAERHLGLEGAARPDPDEGGPFGDRQDLRDGDLDVVGPDSGRNDGDSLPPERPGDGGELPVPVLELDAVQSCGDPWGAV